MGKKSKQQNKKEKFKNIKKVAITSKNEQRKINDTAIKSAKTVFTKNQPKTSETNAKLSPLQLKMKEQLESSRFQSIIVVLRQFHLFFRFRWINEQLYTSTSADALKLMKESPENYDCYHKGYRSQVILEKFCFFRKKRNTHSFRWRNGHKILWISLLIGFRNKKTF